jgi:hypothetical protein
MDVMAPGGVNQDRRITLSHRPSRTSPGSVDELPEMTTTMQRHDTQPSWPTDEIERGFRMLGLFPEAMNGDELPSSPDIKAAPNEPAPIVIVRSNSSSPVRLADGSYA